jgi:hypothetical protein
MKGHVVEFSKSTVSGSFLWFCFCRFWSDEDDDGEPPWKLESFGTQISAFSPPVSMMQRFRSHLASLFSEVRLFLSPSLVLFRRVVFVSSPRLLARLARLLSVYLRSFVVVFIRVLPAFSELCACSHTGIATWKP